MSTSTITSLNPLSAAADLLERDMGDFDRELQKALAEQQGYLTEREHELYRRGKKLRPLILFLASRIPGRITADESLPRKAVMAAVSLEMLHVATLIHDDIIDEAETRRGLPTINALHGANRAILVGDLQFIQAIRAFAGSIDIQADMRLVNLVLDVGFKICCGELDELQTDLDWDTNMLVESYMRTIERKTAAMFGLACECGAQLSSSRNREIFALSRFGRSFGRSFQIMDDLLDLVQNDEDAGKAKGTDLRARRPTLPIIYAMQELPQSHLVHRIMRSNGPIDEDEFQTALTAVTQSGGFTRAYNLAVTTMAEGADQLYNFPASPYRETLLDLCSFIINRGY